MASLLDRYSREDGLLRVCLDLRSDASARDGVPGAEVLYLLLLFPGISGFLGVGLNQLSLVLFVGLIFLIVVVSDGLRLPGSLLAVLLIYAAFLLYAAASMWWSASSEYALHKFTRLAVICSLLVVAPAVTFPDEKRVYTFFKLSLYVSILTAAIIVFGYFSPDYSRPYQILGSASHIRPGRAIGFGIIVATYYVVIATETARRYTYGLMLGILLLGITVSGSRGPFVAALVSAGVLIVLHLTITRGERYRAYLFGLLSALGGLSLVVLHVVAGISVPTVDRIIPLLQGKFDPSTSGRLEEYTQGVLHWLESPLFGNGLGSFPVWYLGEDTVYYPHNFVIEILAELGLIGLLIFSAALAVVLQRLVSNFRLHPMSILLFSLLVFALINASLSKDLQGNRFIFGTIGLTACLDAFPESDRFSRQERG